MKIAIVKNKNSFSERWIEYCKVNNIPYKIVNPYANDIIQQVSDCTAFMWHHHHAKYEDVVFAKQLLYALQEKGLKVFPDFYTTWHFDDKVGQKYLLESVNAPLVPSYVFYTKEDAYQWLEHTTFPKVFKLRGGAGAANVRLVKSKSQAKHLTRKAFGRGFSAYNYQHLLLDSIKKKIHGKGKFYDIAKYCYFILRNIFCGTLLPKQKGYVYFQDFIPNQTYDIRIVVIKDKAFYIKRMVRKGDFRASGSGEIIYEKDKYTEICLKQAFETNEKIKSQCTAYDFVIAEKEPMIVEISYGFAVHGYDDCEGYYTKDMRYHAGKFNPQQWMIGNLIKE